MATPEAETQVAAPRPAWIDLRRYPRHPGDLVRVAVAVLVVVLAYLSVRRDRVGLFETDVFRLVNDLPGFFYPPLWVVMQAGNVLAVAVLAGLAASGRRYRLAVSLALAGGLAYLAALLVKQNVHRGRPADLLPGVRGHGPAAHGLGFVSGHAAVAAALAAVAIPYLPRWGRRVTWTVVVLVCLSRVYVGAHLPWDVVAGAAIGWGIAAVVHLLLGAPSGRPSVSRVRRALVSFGLGPAEVVPLSVDARRSACFKVRTAGGAELFVKVIPQERRDADLLYRGWQVLARRSLKRPARYGSPHQQVEHEAYMSLLAAETGVRTPRVLLARAFGTGSGCLVHEWVGGQSLTERGDARLDDATLAGIWQQTATLRAARIAHGDLEPASIVVDERGDPWLVDFDRSQAGVEEDLLTRDAAELLVTLAGVAGPARAAQAAVEALGRDAVEAAAAGIDGGDLPRAVRRGLRAEDGRKTALLAAVQQAAVRRPDADRDGPVREEPQARPS